MSGGGSISVASPGQGWDCFLKGGLGYLAMGSWSSLVVIGFIPCESAGVAIPAIPRPAVPTTYLRVREGPFVSAMRALLIVQAPNRSKLLSFLPGPSEVRSCLPEDCPERCRYH